MLHNYFPKASDGKLYFWMQEIWQKHGFQVHYTEAFYDIPALMDKKTFLLHIMSSLEDVWAPAAGIKLLIAEDALDASGIEKLIAIFEQLARESDNTAMQAKFAQSATLLQHYAELEATDKLADAAACEELERMMEQL